MEKASLERFLAAGLSLEQIGKRVDRHPATVSYWLKKYGLQAVHHAQRCPKGVLAQADLEELVEEGASIAQIAVRLSASETRVRYWLDKYGLKTRGGVGRRQTREAKREGLAVVKKTCKHHGLTDFWLEGRGYYRCLKCRSRNVAARRRRVKEILTQEAGGQCRICGYSRYLGALEFHHLDPASKSYALSLRGVTRSIDQLRQEASKCVLLCSNCHAEVEGGIASLA